MSSPLRRGTHESWWTAEQGWFNAVAKVYHMIREGLMIDYPHLPSAGRGGKLGARSWGTGNRKG